MGAFEEHDRVHVRLGKDLALLFSTIMAEVDLDRGDIRLKCPKKHCTVLSRVKEIQSFEYREVCDSNTEGRMGGQQSFDIPYLEGSEIGGRHMCEELEETFKNASNVFCWMIEFEIEFSEKFESEDFANRRSSQHLFVPPVQCIQFRSSRNDKGAACHKFAPVDVWEIPLEIKPRVILHNTGEGGMVPPMRPARLAFLWSELVPVMNAHVTKLISAALYLPPTSHCFLARTPSRTPSTRRISFS